VTAWLLRWSKDHTTPLSRTYAVLTADELLRAERVWIRHVQSLAYQSELSALHRCQQLDNRSSIRFLSSFKDEESILRVGGRLHRVLLIYDERSYHLVAEIALHRTCHSLLSSASSAWRDAAHTESCAAKILDSSRKTDGETLHPSICLVRSMAGGFITAGNGQLTCRSCNSESPLLTRRPRLRWPDPSTNGTRARIQGI